MKLSEVLNYDEALKVEFSKQWIAVMLEEGGSPNQKNIPNSLRILKNL